MSREIQKENYQNLDGVRAYAAIGIVLMHVYTNGHYIMKGVLFTHVIPSLGDLVFLFMMISAFSMCCGYYEEFITNRISLEKFYGRRYSKVWPFFAVLVSMDLFISPSQEVIYEAFANLTLCFGLLPNANISVIGVGWTLGVIFVFYIVFPFFCFLISNKKRAWAVLFGSIIMNVLCEIYFLDDKHVVEGFSDRTSFVYCTMFFVMGGLVYLYRKELQQIRKECIWLITMALIMCVIVYYLINSSSLVILFLFTFVLLEIVIIKPSIEILNNSITRYVSGISMEIYLSHMLIYRVVEKLDLLYICGTGIVSYVISTVLVLLGTMCFTICINKGIKILKYLIKDKNIVGGKNV